MKILKMSAALVVMASLAACGGSSANVDMTPTVPTQSDSFRVVQQRALDLAEQYGPAVDAERYTNLQALPTTGTLNYTGAGAYLLGPNAPQNGQTILDNADVLSRVDMQVRLTDGRVTGSASQFYYTGNRQRIDGNLAIRGTLDRATDTSVDYALTGTINGTLQSETAGRIDVATDMYADLYGSNGRSLFGFVDGVATTAEGTDAVQGALIAERQ